MFSLSLLRRREANQTRLHSSNSLGYSKKVVTLLCTDRRTLVQAFCNVNTAVLSFSFFGGETAAKAASQVLFANSFPEVFLSGEKSVALSIN